MSDYTIPALTTAEQTEAMIGRDADLERLHAALRNNPNDRALRVVLVYGQGGMGKTRLLSEALAAAGHPNWVRRGHGPLWTDLNGAILADLIDVIDLRLHDRHQFQLMLRDSLKSTAPALSLPQFDKAERELAVLKGLGVQFDSISNAEETNSQLFVDSLRGLAAERRVVVFIDTVEQFDHVTSTWLIEQDERARQIGLESEYAGRGEETGSARADKTAEEVSKWPGLLQRDDLITRTDFWLSCLISEMGLTNMTLVLAGREERDDRIFDSIRQAVAQAEGRGANIQKLEIKLETLDRDQTNAYFAQQALEWADLASQQAQPYYTNRIASDFQSLAEDRDQSDVIWLLTGGVPVRLAMYAHFIAENHEQPAPLQESFDDLFEQAREGQNVTPEELVAAPTPTLLRLHWEVEDAFVRLLFSQPSELQSRILLALVRAPRGLTAEQLHYCLDADGRSPDQFQPDARRLETIGAVLKRLEAYYLGKRRASGEEFIPTLSARRDESIPFRLGLQDEIYDIFAAHMGLLSEPLDDKTAPIRAALTDAERRTFEKRREREARQRTALYRQLSDWADFKARQFRALKREALAQDERDLELRFDLEETRTFHFPAPGFDETERRWGISEAVASYEVERMVYMILLDLERNLNSEYINLGDDRALAGKLYLDAWAQMEMWRTLQDNALMKFVDFRQRDRAEARGETPLEVLRRFAKQEDVTRWIKRHTLRGRFDRAIVFGADVEKVISALPRQTATESNDYHSWNHTLLRGEHVIWTSYARILRSQDVEGAVAAIQEKAIDKLRPLFTSTVLEPVNGEGLYAEYGFAAGPDHPEHPAEIRLRRLLSHGHNWLGYGHRVLGQMEDAVENYGLALDYVRDDVGLMQAHRAAILNNLSRALSELGWHSTPVCLNGLQLRRELADEVPLAQSYNTLALIYDDMGRYEDAPVLAAKAVAYSRRADARRQLGLCLRQMAESLRHVAIRMQTGQRMLATPDQLYKAADTLLTEARVLFSEINEPSRAIEVLIEWGSLYRDRMEPNSRGERPRFWRDHYREAQHLLHEADELAAGHGRHYHMDIHINIARVHFYAGELTLAEAELEGLLRESYVDKHLIRSRNGRAVIPDPHQNKNLRDRAWTFRYLSTLQMIRGWIALHRFGERVDFHRQEAEKQTTDPVLRRELTRKAVAADKEAQKQLNLTAEAYALGIAYAQLYSPRSRSISALENDLYDRLKAFNQRELQAFHDHLSGLRSRYDGLSSLDSLNNLLHKFLGYPG